MARIFDTILNAFAQERSKYLIRAAYLLKFVQHWIGTYIIYLLAGLNMKEGRSTR